MTYSPSNIDVILNTVNAAVITIDSDGRMLEFNPATTRLFGYRPAELRGKYVDMLMPEPHRSAHSGYIAHYLKTGQAKIIGKGRHVEAQHANGKRIPVHLSIGEHEFNGEKRFTGIINDLSYQSQVSESNARLGRILDESLNEVYVFDGKTLRFKDVSSGALRNLGYTRDDILQMTPVDIKPLFNRERFETLISPLIGGTKPRLQFSTVHQRRDGSSYEVDVSLTYSNSESGAEFFAIIDDVTEKNQLIAEMQQTQKMESVGQLTGGIAHDFNNLLTVISGNLELVQTTKLDKLQHDLIKEAKDASDMGARLTNRLLAFASRSSLSPAPINLNELVIDTSEFLRRTLGENISVNSNLSPKLWLTRIDVSQLENALVNLAVNARDAMQTGGKLSISTANVTVSESRATVLDIEPGDYATLSVSDSGTGIHPEFLQKIFEPFFTTKSGSMGTGLGLSMVYGFTRQSGGCVSVESKAGEGAKFTLFLPKDQNNENKRSATPDSISNDASEHHMILVVEDEESVRKLTCRRLEHLGHTVIEACDGFEALEIYKHTKSIDLIFSDMIMTEGMTGLDLAIAIRKLDPDAKILITSGYADELLDTENLTKTGITLLHKPYPMDDLNVEINKLLPKQNHIS